MITILKTGPVAMINLNYHGKRSEIRLIIFLKTAFFRARLGLFKTLLIFKIELKLA